MLDWLKVIHLLADFSWLAGLFYLPRLMVYHTGVSVGSEADATFIVMERRLLKAIMTPAALVAISSGLALVWVGELDFRSHWLSIKVIAVAGLLGVHLQLSRHAKEFAAGLRLRGSTYFRLLNEVPTVLLIVVVVCVVLKPWL